MAGKAKRKTEAKRKRVRRMLPIPGPWGLTLGRSVVSRRTAEHFVRIVQEDAIQEMQLGNSSSAREAIDDLIALHGLVGKLSRRLVRYQSDGRRRQHGIQKLKATGKLDKVSMAPLSVPAAEHALKAVRSFMYDRASATDTTYAVTHRILGGEQHQRLDGSKGPWDEALTQAEHALKVLRETNVFAHGALKNLERTFWREFKQSAVSSKEAAFDVEQGLAPQIAHWSFARRAAGMDGAQEADHAVTRHCIWLLNAKEIPEAERPTAQEILEIVCPTHEALTGRKLSIQAVRQHARRIREQVQREQLLRKKNALKLQSDAA